MRAVYWHTFSENQRKRRDLRVVVTLLICCLVILAVIAMWLVELRLRPPLVAWLKQKAVQLAVETINQAVNETVVQEIKLGDLVEWSERSPGVLALDVNHAAVNRICSGVTLQIARAFEDLREEWIPLPIGQITGSRLLAALGPAIAVRALPAPAVTTTPYASFQSAGINQTWHRIYLDISVTIKFVAPLIEEAIPVRQQVPVAEEIIVGQVPEVFMSWSQAHENEPLVLPLSGRIVELEDKGEDG